MPVKTRSEPKTTPTPTPTNTGTPSTISSAMDTNPKTWLSGFETVNDVLPFSSMFGLRDIPNRGNNVSLSAVGLREVNGRLRREGLGLVLKGVKGEMGVNAGSAAAATTTTTTTVQGFEGVIEYEVVGVGVGPGFGAVVAGVEGARMSKAELCSRLVAGAEEDKAERIVEMEVEEEMERKKRERRERAMKRVEREKKRKRKRKREEEEEEEEERRKKKGPRLGMFYES